jgi:hypothetical protein
MPSPQAVVPSDESCTGVMQPTDSLVVIGRESKCLWLHGSALTNLLALLLVRLSALELDPFA